MRLHLRVLSLSLLVPILSGCQPAAMHVHVSREFHGQIVVSCDSNGDTGASVTIDAQGRGHASVCPRDGAKVYVDRENTSTLLENVEWLRTGDGLATQFRVAVP